MAKVDFKQTAENFNDINRGLKDVVDYTKQLKNLEAEYSRSTERQRDALSDVLDKTKDIFKNRKELTNEQLNTVDLHKLERQLIAEGLGDQVKFVQQLKQEYNIQKQINREVNAQAKLYENMGSSIDGFIRQIPGIGGMLADVLGTGDLGKQMSEGFRTEMSRGGSGEFFKNVGGEFGGGFLNQMFSRGDVSKSKKAVRNLFAGGLTSAFVSIAAFAATTKMFSIGMEQGFQSMSVANTAKRLFAGSAFEGIREAFGNLGQANMRTLLSMRLNRLRFGVDEKDQAKILAAQVNISGATKDTALNIQKGIARSASLRGVLPADVFQDIANNTEQFAQFAKDGGQNIGEAAIRARELGISLDTVFKVSDNILDFQSSIENELKASLLIGRELNLNRAREFAMMGKMAELQNEIVKQIGSEEELQRMNVIQRKSLAGALGITVSELNRLASGEMEIKNSDMKQNTDAMRNLTFVMAGLAAIMGARLCVQGISYLKTLTRFDGIGFSDIRGLEAVMAAHNPTSKSYQQAESKLKSLQATRTRSAAGGLVRGFGYGALILAAVSGISVLVSKISKSSEDTAMNTKKSVTNELNSRLFTTDSLSGGGVTT